MNRLKARRFGLDTLLRQPPALELYYEAGDPHSHLAAQLLPRLLERISLPVIVRVVDAPEASLYPEAAKQRDFALLDAKRVAPAYGLHFPDHARRPSESACLQAACRLLDVADASEFAAREAEVASALFRGEPLPGPVGIDAPSARAQMAAHGRRRAQLGHYLPGMWQLDGAWYWGVDRMQYLETALRAMQALSGDEALLERDESAAVLPKPPSEPAPLEFYFSFRSPYSYLAAVALQQALPEIPVPVQVRPVLPMAMRGMKIPPRKRMYIVRDVKREADRLGIDFGLIADPLGAGAERCLTAFLCAQGTEQQVAFLVSAGRGIWSEGVDVATDAGLQKVCERAGLDWEAVRTRIEAGMDLAYAETHRTALFEAGLWGVPSYRCGDFVTWGRDRWWLMTHYLQGFSERAALK